MALSKEQKQAKKEAKRQENLRKEEELRIKLRLDELKREMKIQVRKKVEIDKSFKEMMGTIKEPVFKQDIEVRWMTFERLCDKKDFLIHHIIDLMNLANDQYLRLFSSFSDEIDVQIRTFLSELEGLSKQNELKTAAVMQEAKLDSDNLKKTQLSTETQLKLFIYISGSQNEALTWQTRGEFMVREDEDSTLFANKREDLRSELEDKYNIIWESYKATLKSYILNTADLQKKVKRLRMKDNHMSQIIAKQARRINGNDNLLRHLKSELRAYETGTKQAVFRNRQNRYMFAYLKLKNVMKEARAEDSKKISCLVAATNGTLKTLENNYAKSVKILRFVRECRKYESQREKVLPLGCELYDSSLEKDRSPNDELLDSASPMTESLTKLWRKAAQADLIKRALLREKELLRKENAILERRIQENFGSSPASRLHRCICVQSSSNDLRDEKEIDKKDSYNTKRSTSTRVLM